MTLATGSAGGTIRSGALGHEVGRSGTQNSKSSAKAAGRDAALPSDLFMD